jgi:DNA (cytosine-5)-methyltransferase 1
VVGAGELIENVAGFVKGAVSALTEIEDSLDRINQRCNTAYKAHQAVVDAADYGVPQHRSRALIIAFRDGGEFSWPKKTHLQHPVRAWDAIGELDPGPNPPRAVGKWAELLPSIPEGQNYLWHTLSRRGETSIRIQNKILVLPS